MLGGKIDWPWGKAVCQSKLEVKREPLAKAMSEASYEIVMPAQKVRCTLAQKDEGEPYVVEVVDRAEGHLRERQGRDGEPQLGRGHRADAGLCL